MSFLFVPLIEDIPSSPDLFENCHINPEVYLKGKRIFHQIHIAKVYLMKNLQIWNAFPNSVN